MTIAKIISRVTEFEGWHKLENIVIQPKSLKGDGFAAPMKREIYHSGVVVGALLYLPKTDEILLNEQFRVGAYTEGDPNPWLLECSAGKVDDDETPEDAAKREALEETGAVVKDLEYIGKFYPSPGGVSETFHLYCARVDDVTPGIYGLEHEGEEIKTHLVSATRAIEMLDAGKITNGATVICLHWFARNHARLKEKWNRTG